MLRSLALIACVISGAVSAQGTLLTWDRYTILAMSACIVDGITADDAAQAARNARAAAGLTEISASNDTYVLTHDNGTEMTIVGVDGVTCDMVIPEDIFSDKEMTALEADIKNQVGFAFGPQLTTENIDDGEIWTVQGTKDNTITVRFTRYGTKAQMTAASRPTVD